MAIAAVETGAIDPLDAGVVANLDVADELATGDDDAGSLVAADQGQLGRDGPVAEHGVQVRVADARVLDVDEHLIGAGLGDGNPLVHDGCPVLPSQGLDD